MRIELRKIQIKGMYLDKKPKGWFIEVEDLEILLSTLDSHTVHVWLRTYPKSEFRLQRTHDKFGNKLQTTGYYGRRRFKRHVQKTWYVIEAKDND